MWTLKRNITILIKKEGIRINRVELEKNQDLAELVLNNPEYNEKWGHNFEQVDSTRLRDRKSATVKPDEIIQVDIKKKTGLASEKSEGFVSTSNAPLTDGMTLNFNEQGQQSPSAGSKQSKQGNGNQNSQGRK